MTTDNDATLRRWEDLDDSERTELRVGSGRYLDTLPPTCSLETKIERFRRWLREQGIDYSGIRGEDLPHIAKIGDLCLYRGESKPAGLPPRLFA